MIEFHIEQLLPRFLLGDRSGYAMAKAIEAMLNIFLAKVQEGVDCILDPEKMPEWRLDEMAWEYNCPYDYHAAIDAKRRWIADAYALSALIGTPAGLYKYIEGYFAGMELEEWYQYGGEPCHFRMTLSGQATKENMEWAVKATQLVKNLRSELDSLSIGGQDGVIVRDAGASFSAVYARAGADMMCGTWPIV